MQEIEYRAWDKCNERMIESRNILKICMSRLNQQPYLIIYLKKWMNENREIREIDKCYTNEFELSQYIGIKDIHQNKVFRGDIVKVKQIIYTDCSREEVDETREYIGEVVWHLHGWCIAEKIEDGIRYHFLWTWNIEGEEDDTMEIIGNRWDNPEMAVVA